MKRRLMIARALIHEPSVLILDEPTAGVDIEMRRSMYDFLREINEAGTTIILTTHYLEEAESLCRNIAIINHGEIVTNTSIKNLLRELHRETFILDSRQALPQTLTVDGFELTRVDDFCLEAQIEQGQDLGGAHVAAPRAGHQHSEYAQPGESAGADVCFTVGAGVVSPYEQWVALLTLMRKEIRRYTRIWSQTLLPSAITMSLYFLIFGSLIGSRIGEMGGVSYMEFVVPGLIMMAIVTNSYANVVSSFFGAKFNNSIEELLVSPTPNHIILLGFVSGGVSRGMLVAVIVTLVSSLFVDLAIHSYAVVVAVVALTSVLFSLCGLINAVFANTFDDINIVPTFVLTPLTYLGGVFYSLELLPDFWATVSQANPLVYVVNAFRFGVLGVSDVSVGFAFSMIGAFTLVAYLYAAHLLRTGKRLRT